MFAFICSVAMALIKLAFYVILWAYGLIVWLSNLMCKPFGLLPKKLTKVLSQKQLIPADLNQRFSVFNGFVPFLLFAFAILFSTVAFLISSHTWNINDNYFTQLMYNTTLGSFIGFMTDGLDFTPATLVAIAFSHALLPLCMNTHNKKDKKAPIYIRIPCYIVYLLASAVLASMLAGVFQSVGQWGYQTMLSLYAKKAGNFLLAVGKIIALIPLAYVALLLCLITIRTYAECFVFGLIGMVAIIVFGLLLSLIPEAYATLNEVLTAIVILGIFFGLDVLQAKAIDKVDRYMDDESIGID